jgi:hypothetical protein
MFVSLSCVGGPAQAASRRGPSHVSTQLGLVIGPEMSDRFFFFVFCDIIESNGQTMLNSDRVGAQLDRLMNTTNYPFYMNVFD